MRQWLAHSRQFVVGPRPLLVRADWQSVELDDGRYLSHCPKLASISTSDRRNRRWFLLGAAVQVDSARTTPEEELRGCAIEDIGTVYQTWAGRWLLIGNDSIHPDASGTFGCYYRMAAAGSGGAELWVSSSLALLANLPGQELRPDRPPRSVASDGFGWDPPPGTAYPGIKKLLPSQILVTSSGRIQPRPLRIRPSYSMTYEQILDEIAGYLVTAMRNLSGRINVALSAGYDSRLVLAAAKAAGVPFTTYTQTFPAMTAADLKLPPLLAKLAGVEHFLVHPQAQDPRLLALFDAHSGGQSMDMDRRFFGRGQWGWTKPGDVLVRGGCFEVARCFYWKRFPASRPPLDELLRMLGAVRCRAYVRESMAACLDWFDQTAVEGMDWRDRFYLEVRAGGWASANQQALDIVDGDIFLPANAACTLGTLLALPPEKRQANRHHIDLIERLAPELLCYPFNETDGLIHLTRRRVRKYAGILREHGMATTVLHIERAMVRWLRRHGAPGLMLRQTR